MELWQIAIPVVDDADASRLLGQLRDLRVPLDPCRGDPRYAVDPGGTRRMLVLVNARVRDALSAAGRKFEVVRDLADAPDPRHYVSRKDRYAEELARVRAAKGKR